MPHDFSEPLEAIGALTRTDFVKFAGAGGDFNPMHFDDLHAKASGFPSVFAMGMLTAGVASRLVRLRAGLSVVRGLDVRFRGMVWPDEPLFARTEWASSDIEGDDRRLEFEIVNASGEVKVSGSAAIARR